MNILSSRKEGDFFLLTVPAYSHGKLIRTEKLITQLIISTVSRNSNYLYFFTKPRRSTSRAQIYLGEDFLDPPELDAEWSRLQKEYESKNSALYVLNTSLPNKFSKYATFIDFNKNYDNGEEYGLIKSLCFKDYYTFVGEESFTPTKYKVVANQIGFRTSSLSIGTLNAYYYQKTLLEWMQKIILTGRSPFDL